MDQMSPIPPAQDAPVSKLTALVRAGIAGGARIVVLSCVCVAGAAAPSSAQTSRLAVLLAEDRRAPTPADLAVIRAGLHGEPETVRTAVRALGRLERPSLIPDILPSLRNPLPEICAEAANAVGQAAQGWKEDRAPGAMAVLEGAASALAARLKVEADPDVRGAICETVGRLPYPKTEDVGNAEQVLVEAASRGETVTDRLGVAKGLEALVRVSGKLKPPGPDAIAALKRLAIPAGPDAAPGTRVRRLALSALIGSAAADLETLTAGARDPDAQVRAITMRAAPPALVAAGLADNSPMVRLEALRRSGTVTVTSGTDGAPSSCASSLAAATDRDAHVALLALDQLAGCGGVPEALATLDRAVADLALAGSPRGWHRAAHALVALAAAAPERGTTVLAQFTGSRTWQLRMYAARAAATLGLRSTLEGLAADEDDNVREAAVEGLSRIAGHDADVLYVAQLARPGYQVVRAAALALVDSAHPAAATPALEAALQRLIEEGRDNSHDARDAIAKALVSLGGKSRLSTDRVPRLHGEPDLTADDLRRLASPRARVTVSGVGTFDLALFTSEAPAAVARFVHLAETGYYNGLTYHRVVPNFVVQGGSPGANEYVGDARFMRDEVGLWPHVRGAAGISTRGHDTGDAQIFIDLVDNPRLDHQYTVFGQVLNGIDIVDQIMEGDVIERIEIVLHVP
jgi:cyclophilin family peptidyl-prolyl cis-trans isomerase